MARLEVGTDLVEFRVSPPGRHHAQQLSQLRPQPGLDAALHPEILAVAEQLFRDEHRAAAVFEAAKAVHNRIKKMTNLSGDGAGLMGTAFKDDQPAVVLADLTTQTGKDIQAGYRGREAWRRGRRPPSD